MFKLTIEDDDGKTTVIPVIRDEMTIGRQEGNTIRLTERNVSRRHARVVRQNGAVFIEDLASFTGVRVNGLKIAALTPFRDGDQVQIGDYKIHLKVERPPMVDGGDRATMPTMHAAMGTTAQYGAPVLGRNGNVPMVAPADTEIPTAPLLRFPSPQNLTEMPAGSLPVPGTMEGQPTIPVRRLDDPPPRPDEEIVTPARLVVVSTELAGMEFSLARPSVVIGRTDENDITLNHRSISRHHAKVVRERDHYTILDLQSANGVRVNGEDYERIELHAGDMVELGHVRVRFVGPGETFVFDPKAAAAANLKFPAKAAMTLVGISLAAVAIVVFQRSSGPRVVDRPAEVAELRPAETPPTVAAAEATPAPAPATPPPAPATPVAAPPSAADFLAKAATEAKGEDWDAALSSLDQLGARAAETADPLPRLTAAQQREAAVLRRKIEAERRGALAFAKFEEASGAKKYAEALDHFTEIPADSLYKKRARPRFEEARTLYVSQHLTAAEKFRTAGKCTEAKLEAEQVEKVDPRNQLVKDLMRTCKPRGGGESPVAVAMAGARPPRPRPVAPSVAVVKAESTAMRPASETAIDRTAEAPAADAEPDADALIKQAREAWMRQQCGSAIDLSRKALKAKPGLTDAYQVIAVCSCSLKDADGATRAYTKLDDRSRSLVKALCVKHGISVGGE